MHCNLRDDRCKDMCLCGCLDNCTGTECHYLYECPITRSIWAPTATSRIRREARIEGNTLIDVLNYKGRLTPTAWKRIGKRVSMALRDILATGEKKAQPPTVEEYRLDEEEPVTEYYWYPDEYYNIDTFPNDFFEG